MVRIFISYRRKDSAALATLLAKELGRQGIKTFVDTRSIDGGGPFPDRLRRAIAECHVFVCLLGATTLNSDWVREEIKHAHTLNKILIPVFQETYTPPDPIPDEHVYALLQSDGITILDVRNLFVDQSIADLARMIRQSVSRRLPRALLVAAAVLFIVAAAAILIPNIIPSPPTGTPSPTTTAASVIAGNPTATDAPTDTPTPRPTDTPEALQAAFTPVTSNADWTPVERDFDGVTMVLVPAGSFEMGSTPEEIDSGFEMCQQAADNNAECQRSWFEDEAQNGDNTQTFNEPFWIDRTEVTRAQYQVCIDAGICEKTPDSDYSTEDDQPINRVTWFQAQTYCEWREARLPTEAEWEYAARGPERFIFPWGNEFDGSRANHCDSNCGDADWASSYTYVNEENDDGFAMISPVASYPEGASWVGATDMAGNVWEWTSSLYEDYPYNEADGRERDTGDSTDVLRVLRGGSWINFNKKLLDTLYRLRGNSGDWNKGFGFRCARDAGG